MKMDLALKKPTKVDMPLDQTETNLTGTEFRKKIQLSS